jgi:hypothetical protein
MEVDKYDTEKVALIRMKGNLSPDEYRNKWRELNDKYTFGELLSLARGDQKSRDEAYTYNVLNRVPPGQRDDLFNLFGINYDMVQQFYGSKGETLTTWNQSDRDLFMAAINAMGATLSLPDDATKAKWAVATDQYTQMMNEIDLKFGAGTTDIMYEINGWNQTLQERYIRKHPEVISARNFRESWIQRHPEMIPYYSSADKIWGYYRNQAYAKISKELGPGVFSSWGYRSDRQIQAQDVLNEWEKAHPEWAQIQEKLSQRKAAKALSNETLQNMFETFDQYKYATDLSEEYTGKINDFVKQNYGIDYEKAKEEWDYVNAVAPWDGGEGLQNFLVDYPYWDDINPDNYGGPVLSDLRAERNQLFVDKYGTKYSEFWTWYDHFKSYTSRDIAAIDAEMDVNNWWDLVDEHGVLYDELDKASELTPEQQKYLELRKQYMEDSAKVALEVMKSLRPIDWPSSRPTSTGENYKKISSLINKPFAQQYSMTWDELTQGMSRVAERVVLDYLKDDDELPYAAESQLQRLAEEKGIDYYLYIQQLRNALEYENR